MPLPLLRPISVASIMGGDRAPPLTGADLLLSGTLTGLGIDFLSSKRFGASGQFGDLVIRSGADPGLAYAGPPYPRLTAAGLKLVRGHDGLWTHNLHNLCPKSEDLSSTWTLTNVTQGASSETPPSISGAATKVTDNSSNGFHACVMPFSGIQVLLPHRLGIILKYGSAQYICIGVDNNSTAYAAAGFDLVNGAVTGTGQQGTGYSASNPEITPLGGGWYLLTAEFTIPTVPRSFGFVHRATEYTSGRGMETYAGDGDKHTHFAGAFMQLLPAPKRYLATGTGSSPVFAPAPAFDAAGTNLGLPYEPSSAENIVASSNDLSHTSWTKRSMTASRTATGPDGRDDSATTLTASANNAAVLQIITDTSEERYAAAFVRRRTGTGDVALSQGEVAGDELIVNGTFDTDIDGWTATEQGTSSDPPDWNAGGSMNLYYNNSTNYGYAYQVVTLTPGKVYRLSADIAGGGATLKVGTSANGVQVGSLAVSAGTTGHFVFVATAASTYITIAGGAGGSGRTADNITLKEVVETVLSLTDEWQYLSIPPATIADPLLCIRIAASGDAVDVAHVQCVEGSSVSSPIVGAATRPADAYRIAQDDIPWNAGSGELQIDGIVEETPTTDDDDLLVVPRAGESHVRTFRWIPS